LRANIGVTVVTQLSLHFRQQKLRCGRGVDGVAIGADDIVLRVGRAADIRAGNCLSVAAQAVVQDLFGLELRKSDNGRLSAVSLHVSLAGAVAALAPGMVRRLLAGGDAFEVRVLIKFRPDVGMAGFARLAAYESAGQFCRGAALRNRRWLLREGGQSGGEGKE